MTLSKTEWQGGKRSRKNSEPASRTIKTMPQNNFPRSWQLGKGRRDDTGCRMWSSSACWPTCRWRRRNSSTPPPKDPQGYGPPHIDKGVETCDFVIDTKKPLIGTLTLLMLWQISPKDRWRGPFLALTCVGCPRTQAGITGRVDQGTGWTGGNRMPFRKWRCRNHRRRKSVPHYAA